ncbi:hypothetical protein L208DRAFT_1533023 [Tricholoma matsutake]|nr:hypothetical protein L208DRAFT_1533023 [Tricholoma matsutake 945]
MVRTVFFDHNRLPKLWAIYLKACGLSARAFDAIHALGITMSHKWAADAYGTLSNLKMKEVQAAVQNKPWTILHDNVNLPLRVFSQRLHNQSHFVSGCAATHHAKNCGQIFPVEDVLYGNDIMDKHMEAQYIYHILRVLYFTILRFYPFPWLDCLKNTWLYQ